MNIEQERELFEEWFTQGMDEEGSKLAVAKNTDGRYLLMQARTDWQAWQARAKVNCWISVEEDLPELNQEVMYFFEVIGAAHGWYYGEGSFGGKRGYLHDEVTHWMPLSEPTMNGE